MYTPIAKRITMRHCDISVKRFDVARGDLREASLRVSIRKRYFAIN